MQTIHRACLALTLFCAGAAQAGDLAIRVDDVKLPEGRVMAALFDSATGFLKRSVKVGDAAADSGGTVTVVIKDVPAGDYALALYHDLNGNGRMDRNVIGIPIEPYAFSNNVLGTMGPPSFEQARFAVPPEGTTVTVSLR